MIYNLSAVHVKNTEIERKHIMIKCRKKYLYNSMETVAKKRFLENIKRKYSTMDAIKKKKLLSQSNEKLVKARSLELCINQFKKKIREGSNLYVLRVIKYFIRNQ